jgi:hypothetical protein
VDEVFMRIGEPRRASLSDIRSAADDGVSNGRQLLPETSGRARG